MLSSTPAARVTGASASTSSARTWRWSGRGCTVMPCAPAASTARAAATGEGRAPPRELRSTAILLTLTESFVIARIISARRPRRASAAALGDLLPHHRVPVAAADDVALALLVEVRRDHVGRVGAYVDGEGLVLVAACARVGSGQVVVVDQLRDLDFVRARRDAVRVLVGGTGDLAVDREDPRRIEVLRARRDV